MPKNIPFNFPPQRRRKREFERKRQDFKPRLAEFEVKQV
jgi:hypothetical protein